MIKGFHKAKVLTLILLVLGLCFYGSGSASASWEKEGASKSPSSSSAEVVNEPLNDARIAQDKPSILSRLSDLKDKSTKEQAAVLSLPESGPGSLLRGENNTVRVEVKTDDLTSGLEDLKNQGAEILHVSKNHSIITANLPLDKINTVSREKSTLAITAVMEPQLLSKSSSTNTTPVVNTPGSCSVLNSEANDQLKASLAKSTKNVNGQGVPVGILSDSFDIAASANTRADADVAFGALPGIGNPCGRTTPVNVISEYTNAASDEGRAMAQLVHSVAPGSPLLFATAFISESAFADNIIALKDAGAKVIVDDVTYLAEPMFQEGIIAKAVAQVTASGVVYLSSAGNNNLITNGKNIASFEAPAFRPTQCPTLINLPGDCMNFDSSGGVDNSASFTIGPNSRLLLTMQYAQPIGDITTDLDIFLLDPTQKVMLSASVNANNATQTSYELLSYFHTSGTQTVDVVILRYWGSGTPRVKFQFLQNGSNPFLSAQYNTSNGTDIIGPTVYGHNGGASTVSVAAAAYNNNTAVETYSSRGPNTLYFEPVNAMVPSAALATPKVLSRPDITGTDGDCTTGFFGTATKVASCPYRFYGTSAAAPNVAGVVALMRQYNPTAEPDAIKSALKGSATALSEGTAGGSGLVNANAAITLLGKAAPSAPKLISATAGNGQVSLAWEAPVSNGGSPVVSYTARSNDGQTCDTTGLSCSITNLQNGTLYTFSVVARNSDGVSVSSNSITAVPRTVPGKPLLVTTVAGKGSITVSWSAPASNGGYPVQSYTVTGSPDGSCTVTGLSCTIKNLDAGTGYTYTVRASSVIGSGINSDASNVVHPLPYTVPSQVGFVTATAGNAQATVSWSGSTDDGGKPISQYTVTSNPGGITCVVAGLSCTIAGLQNNVAYTFAVQASNVVGASIASAASGAVVPRAPTSIPGVGTISKVKVGSKKVTVYFKAGANGGLRIDAYQVLCQGPKTRTTNGMRSPITVSGLKSGKYRCYVRAHNANGWGGYTAAIAVKVK